MQFDHLVIVVSNLKDATTKFEKAGFTVSSGGTHFAGISENKLIFLGDNTFIELLRIRNSVGGLAIKFLYYTKLHLMLRNIKTIGLPYRFYFKALERSKGLYDFCFLANDLKQEENRLETSKIAMSTIINAGRKRPDGNILKWKMSTPISSHLPFIRDPFVSEHPTPKSDPIVHENGVVGIKSIQCQVQNINQIASDILAFYGANNCQVEDKSIVVKTPNTQLIYMEEGIPKKAVRKSRSDQKINFIIDYNFENNADYFDRSSILEYITTANQNK